MATAHYLLPHSLVLACSSIDSDDAGESGNSNDESSNLNSDTAAMATGQFVDSPVAGLRFVSGSLSGITDTAGNVPASAL